MMNHQIEEVVDKQHKVMQIYKKKFINYDEKKQNYKK